MPVGAMCGCCYSLVVDLLVSSFPLLVYFGVGQCAALHCTALQCAAAHIVELLVGSLGALNSMVWQGMVMDSTCIVSRTTRVPFLPESSAVDISTIRVHFW
jgi:hypothetical protein